MAARALIRDLPQRFICHYYGSTFWQLRDRTRRLLLSDMLNEALSESTNFVDYRPLFSLKLAFDFIVPSNTSHKKYLASFPPFFNFSYLNQQSRLNIKRLDPNEDHALFYMCVCVLAGSRLTHETKRTRKRQSYCTNSRTWRKAAKVRQTFATDQVIRTGSPSSLSRTNRE